MYSVVETHNLNSVLVRFVYRFANSVAHELANAAYSMLNGGEYFDTPPAFIKYVLNADMI